MQQIPNDYSIFPRELVKEGVTLLANVYVYLPQNKSMLLFRKPGNQLVIDDIQSFDKIPIDRLLYPKSEEKLVNEMRAKVLSLDLAKGDISSAAVKASAAGMLQSIQPTQDANCMDQAALLVQSVLKGFKKTASTSAFDEALKKASLQEGDLLGIHHTQVSTVAVLMALTVGDFSMDDISDLAAAGLVHDLGLADITNSLAESHYKGVKKLDNQEKIIYMRHIGYTHDQIKKRKIPVTPGIQRIIDHHHENWNGTGFKSMMGNRIYRPARILRIADDLISLVQVTTDQLDFNGAMKLMSKDEGAYDPDMLNKIMGNPKASA